MLFPLQFQVKTVVLGQMFLIVHMLTCDTLPTLLLAMHFILT